MARIRTVKPEFFRHEGLFQAEQETGLPLRVAFAGLWTASDREGRFEWRPKQLKLDCLPYDEVDFSRVLDALATRGFIVRYTCGTDEYGYIPSWRKHQVINGRESHSKIPEPNEIKEMPTREGRVKDACPTRHSNAQGEGEGKGKGREDTAPAISTGTTAREQPPAGVAPAEAGQANPEPEARPPVKPPPASSDPGPRPIGSGLSLDALRVTPGVGTDDHAASGALWAVLAANSCKGTASHPSVVEMARAGVTVDELRRAIAEARKTSDGQLNPAYLAAIVERLRTDAAKPKTRGQAWATDDSALEAKAKELGMWPTKAGSYQELRGLVRAKLDARAGEAVR